MNTLISIIVPVYNAETYLCECIESILNQTFSNIELILVDDGSTDNSLSICKKYENVDKRIKIISKKNSGVSDTRNLGLLASNGEYVCFVDSDDMIKKDTIEILYREMDKGTVDMVFCNFEYDYSGRRVRKKSRLLSGTYNISSLNSILIDDGTMSGILFGSVCTCLYKRKKIKDFNIRFDSDIKHNEDGLFNLRYLKFCNSVKVLDDKWLYIYRFNENSASKTVNLHENKFIKANSVIKELYLDNSMDNLQEQMYARNVSIAFWEILEICNEKNRDFLKNKLNMIKNICVDIELIKSLTYIKTNKMNKYKLLYYYLIKFRIVIPIYIITRYIYPTLKRIVER